MAEEAYSPGNVRGENAAALVVLHMKEQGNESPTTDEVTKFILDHDLLGDVMSMDWEQVEKKLQDLKTKGVNDGETEGTRERND